MAAPAPEHLAVLLVEDDEDDYVLTRDLLRAQSRTVFTVDWAATYDAARELIKASQHDVYLIDYRLGGRTGLELVRDAFAGDQRAPVIVLTGQNDYEVDLEATRLGVTDFLLKDQLDSALLERSIRYAVSHHAALGELRSSRERYELAVRGANDGIWDWDLTANRVFFSARWKAMLGHTDQDVGDSSEEWLGRTHADDAPSLRAAIQDHLAGGSPHLEIEHRMLHSDGDYRWVVSRGVAIRDRNGEVTRMAGSMSDITDRKSAERQLLHDALHDALTELPNRALFLDRLTLSLARGARHPDYRCAVLFIDLDRFKLVNDSYSHDVGDRLLIAIARRLSSALRPGDTVARLGGDEFTVLLDEIGSDEEALTIAERIQHAVSESFRLDGRDLFVTASIGISLSGPGDTPEELLRNADIAMYHAKREGTARTAIFDISMHSRVLSRLKLETVLRLAIEDGRMRVFYQPIVDLGSGRLVAFEALARWPAGETCVAPAEFIPVAEDTGLIRPLGRVVLESACQTLMGWRASGLAGETLGVSVNVSGCQLSEGDLPMEVAEILAGTGLPAEALRLEVTESAVMRDPERMRSALGDLGRHGVQAHIDDFGTGHSSLTFLHRFPGNTIKIDRSFVSSLHRHDGSETIVRSIVALAHNLGLQVIAEGVDHPAQVDRLRALGCEYAQGFLFSEPVDAGEAESLLRTWDTSAASPAAADLSL